MVIALLTGLAGCGRKAVEEDDDTFFASRGLTDGGFWRGVRALDYVEMFNYQAMVIPRDVHQISDGTIYATIYDILSNFAKEERLFEGFVIWGDTLNIDFVGSVDGVEFDGGNTFGMGYDVTIGETQFIDDFLEQLLGHEVGDVVNVEVTFPDFYPQSPDLEGRDALFVVTINYIIDEVPPELTDAFVLENLYNMYEWRNIADMKEEIR
jgi:trigger factor